MHANDQHEDAIRPPVPGWQAIAALILLLLLVVASYTRVGFP
jgi:hypothetical protein